MSSSSSANAPAYEDFDTCHELAVKTAHELSEAGERACVVSGYFHPDTPIETWDYRWQQLAARHGATGGFIHYWVESGKRIIDPAVRQFGYPGPIETTLSDPRYQRTPLSYR